VSFQELLLTETLIALIAVVRFLICVDEHVRLQVAGRYRSVRTEVALVTLFTLVGLVVYLVTISIGEGFAAPFAFKRFVGSVKLLDVNP
jgi:hypothetical protein